VIEIVPVPVRQRVFHLFLEKRMFPGERVSFGCSVFVRMSRPQVAASRSSNAARPLDESEQDAVIAELQRSAHFSDTVFRAFFGIVSVCLFVALHYLAIRITIFDRTVESLLSASSARKEYARGAATLVNAWVAAITALRVVTFRPIQDRAGLLKSGTPASVLPPATTGEALRRSRLLWSAAVWSIICVVHFELWSSAFSTESLDWGTLLWWGWPPLYHAAAVTSLAWMQDSQDGISTLRKFKYSFQTA
jgi:hypothetical protein